MNKDYIVIEIKVNGIPTKYFMWKEEYELQQKFFNI